MTEEKLKRVIQIDKLLKGEIVTLLNPEKYQTSQIGHALFSLLSQDEKFRTTFVDALNEVKSRLATEFNEL